MIISCNICHLPFKENDEVRGLMDAYWHELGSRVHFSLSKPHNVLRDSLRHRSCEESEDLC